MNADERNAVHRAARAEGLDGMANPGSIGQRRLAELAERRVDPAPTPVKVMSDHEREIAFLLSYVGDDKGLLWRKANAEREVRQRQAREQKEEEERNALARQTQASANADVRKMIRAECFKVAHGVGDQLGQVVERFEKKITGLSLDVEIANKRSLLAKVDAEVAKAAPMQGSNEFFYLDGGRRQDAALHAAIIGPVDNPVDQNIMKPIRDRRRAEHVEEQRAKLAERRGQRRAR
ncbi:hypothetical protein JQ636_37955 [Bradyrhizobium japonicum]|uniref:hypothetical protein n=1 Tax=Bradyrhizobium japonicum TaxID=375 RepID=UPI001BAC760C|nr:hypothetical protein [Bradyrhizobium japonicum]MBR0809348.1 hypothetical protein [Bradyrhizobium japonicum]